MEVVRELLLHVIFAAGVASGFGAVIRVSNAVMVDVLLPAIVQTVNNLSIVNVKSAEATQIKRVVMASVIILTLMAAVRARLSMNLVHRNVVRAGMEKFVQKQIHVVDKIVADRMSVVIIMVYHTVSASVRLVIRAVMVIAIGTVRWNVKNVWKVIVYPVARSIKYVAMAGAKNLVKRKGITRNAVAIMTRHVQIVLTWVFLVRAMEKLLLFIPV